MSTLAFIQKVRWIRRRARRIKNFYGVSRPIAVFDAHLDWISLNLPATGDHRHDHR